MKPDQSSSVVLDQSVTATGLIERYRSIRRFTESLCDNLITEDYVVQSMPDVSPTKWHLGHTSWFFEQMILTPHGVNRDRTDPRYHEIFNSYYNTLGEQWQRDSRGLLSRPSVQEVYAYRAAVDARMLELLEARPDDGELHRLAFLGLQHEQQHQELLLTDIKHVLSLNPFDSALTDPVPVRPEQAAEPLRFIGFDGGLVEIGAPRDRFHFDNEGPAHDVWLRPFELASRPISNAEFREFIEDGGYDRAELWLDKGWKTVQAQGWRAPLYWEERDGVWSQYTLAGRRPVRPDEPVAHVSFFEADAFARWHGQRLPTEAEWEWAAAGQGQWNGAFAESRRWHPAPISADAGQTLDRMFGDIWEWTSSSYAPYPGYRPWTGAIGEYNGKWMVDQLVLRGGSCASPRNHVRLTYRNFFPADARWQFSGVRLARDPS